MGFINTLLSLSRGLARGERISSNNIFVVEIYNKTSGVVYETRPNWWLIVPLIVFCTTLLVSVTAFLCYRVWRKKNCLPIYFAGKTTYLRRGSLLHDASDFISEQKADLSAKGLKVTALFADAEQSIPLEMDAVITAPVFIHPKIEK